MGEVNARIVNGRRLLLGCALAALSALLLTLSFPPYGMGWLVWLAMVPMVVAEYRVLPAAWSALAPAIGFGGFMEGYFGGFFPDRAAWYMKALPLLVTVIIFAASRGERARRDRVGYSFLPIAAATTWVAVEFARMPALGTWGFFGYALYREAWILQPVRVVGIFGLDLLIVLANYAMATAVIARLDRRGVFASPVQVVPQHAALWCGGVLLALGVWCALGRFSGDAGDPSVRVAVLQPGFRRNDVGDTPDVRDRAMLERLTAQTRVATSRGARLVVWPEAALSRDPETAYKRDLADLTRTSGATIVVGYGIYTPAGRRNEAVTVDPSGEFVGRYGKDHPVGFLGETSIWRGTYPTVDAPFGRMGTIICYDMDFTDTARQLARRGAKIIAVPSADWPAIAAKHYTFAVFRALETGAVLAKSEYNRDSAIVDGYGRIHTSAVTPTGSEAVLVADVPLRAGVPLAARLGDWIGWLCLAGMLGRMLSRLFRRRPRTAS
jgi:apolipoprotein N-acyltransferase